mgnify:CR=1 FL=1
MAIRVNEYCPPFTADKVTRDNCRKLVGGLWKEMGELQLNFMKTRGGLLPEMTLLDLGCGCFRGGIHFIRYLNEGGYYGLDISTSLISAGFEYELPQAGLKLARDHVIASDHFDASSFGVQFDRVLAVSLWTHLPLNHIQRSLWEVSRVLKPGGIFYTSVFWCPDPLALLSPLRHESGGVVSYRDLDPYHYCQGDFDFLLFQLSIPLRLQWIGEWEHPRDQQMVAFHRLDI